MMNQARVPIPESISSHPPQAEAQRANRALVGSKSTMVSPPSRWNGTERPSGNTCFAGRRSKGLPDCAQSTAVDPSAAFSFNPRARRIKAPLNRVISLRPRVVRDSMSER
jgi:hypothetical protein